MTDKQKTRAEEEEFERFAYSLPHSADGFWPKDIDPKSVEARTKYGVHHCWSYEQVMNIARHFAEWQRRKDQEIDKLTESPDLDEASWNYSNRDGITYGQRYAMQIDFKAGAKWQKQQMMEEALDCSIIIHPNDRFANYSVSAYVPPLHPASTYISNGDRVKIIIIREEEK